MGFFQVFGVFGKPKTFFLFQDILLYNCRKLVEKVPLFKDAPTEFLVDICLHLERQVYLVGEDIIQSGGNEKQIHTHSHKHTHTHMLKHTHTHMLNIHTSCVNFEGSSGDGEVNIYLCTEICPQMCFFL